MAESSAALNSTQCDAAVSRVFVIAEIGSNHNCSLQVALDSIDSAANAGADAVKFQSIDLHELYHSPSEATRSLHRQIDLPEEWHAPLKDRCDERGVMFISSPTYLRAVDVLESLRVQAYKIASAQAGVFPQLVHRVAALHKAVFLSTGLVTLDQLDEVVGIFQQAGNRQLTILHCNSVYPAPPEIVHLGRMSLFSSRYGVPVGFSDHTTTSTAAVMAVAMGATTIEKHFTLSRHFSSPDAACSIEPLAFSAYVDSIREAEAVMKPETARELEPEEEAFKNRIQHGLLATARIAPGAPILVGANVLLKRGTEPSALTAVDLWRLPGPLYAVTSIEPGSWIRPEQVTEVPVASSCR